MGDWVKKQVSNLGTGLTSLSSSAMSAVGSGVSGAGKGMGDSISNTSRTWGDSVRGYGNSIKDATGASGPRAVTASNPLGLAGSKEGARAGSQVKKGVTGVGSRGTGGDPLGIGGRF